MRKGERNIPEEKMRRNKSFVFYWFCSDSACPHTASVTGTDTATDSVRAMLDEVIAIQNDPKLAGNEMRGARRDLIRKVIMRNFDFGEMLPVRLGPEQWEKLNNAQRSEFKSIFQDLFLDSYSRLVLDFLRQEKDGIRPR